MGDKLRLKQALLECGLNEEQATLALISIAGRALLGASEHKTADWLAGLHGTYLAPVLYTLAVHSFLQG